MTAVKSIEPPGGVGRKVPSMLERRSGFMLTSAGAHERKGWREGEWGGEMDGLKRKADERDAN